MVFAVGVGIVAVLAISCGLTRSVAIQVGSGNDGAYGEAGDDQVRGWTGDDTASGGTGNGPRPSSTNSPATALRKPKAIDADAHRWGRLETGGALVGRISYECRTITVTGLVDAPPDSVRGEAKAVRGVVRFGMPGTVGELLAVPSRLKEPETSEAAIDEPRVLLRPCPCCGGRMILVERFAPGFRQSVIGRSALSPLDLVGRLFQRRGWVGLWSTLTDPLVAWALHALALWALPSGAWARTAAPLTRSAAEWIARDGTRTAAGVSAAESGGTAAQAGAA